MPRDPAAPWRNARRPRPEPHVARLLKRVAAGQTLAEAAASLGIPVGVARAEFVRSGLPVPVPPRVPRAAPALDDFGVLLALRLLAHQLGAERMARGAVPVSRREWDERRDPSLHPSAATMTARFGGWGAACERAGVPLRPLLRRSGPVRRWTDEQCLAAAREFLAQAAGGTACSDYAAWATGRDVPSLPTVTSRFGGWPRTRELAGG